MHHHLQNYMMTSVIVQSAIKVQYLKKKKRRTKMKDNFHIGFVVGMITALFMAIVVSCSMTPLEAGSSEIGSNAYNPLYVHVTNCD